MKVALKLFFITAICGALLWGVNSLTAPIIQKNRDAAKTENYKQMIEFDDYEIKEINVGPVKEMFTAKKGGSVVGYIFLSDQANNYGNIELMTLISPEGEVMDVKITTMNQTAGFAEKVNNEDFLNKFDGPFDNAEGVDTKVGATFAATTTKDNVLNSILIYKKEVLGEEVEIKEDAPKADFTTMANGTYEGEYQGFEGLVKVRVIIKDGKAIEVTVLEQKESMPQNVFEVIPTRVVEANSVDVETVAGSTVSSKALLQAINEAMLNKVSDSTELTPVDPVEPVEKTPLNVADGTYTATAKADAGSNYTADINVSVTVKDGIITDLTIEETNVTGTAFAQAPDKMKEAIMNANSTEVDTVAGNTVTSNAIIEAVNKALNIEVVETPKLDVADGTYNGTAKADAGSSYAADINVTVTVKGGVITDLTIEETNVTGHAFKQAPDKMKEAIMNANSTEVDTVAGNTVTSKAIIEAVNNALNGTSGSETEGSKLAVADGTYNGTAKADAGSSYTADINVTVTVKDGIITDLTIEETNVTGHAFAQAPAKMKEAIMNANSTEVDTVAGNTVTSKAIIEAVNNALGL